VTKVISVESIRRALLPPLFEGREALPPTLYPCVPASLVLPGKATFSCI